MLRACSELNNDGPGTACNLSAHQQSEGALRFHAMKLRTLGQGPQLIGPDTGYRDAQQWLQAFLPPVAAVLHAVTHHVYDAPSRSSYNSPGALDRGRSEIAWYTAVIASSSPHSQIWAGEDGPIGGGNDGTCGGDKSVCGSYASALGYADDLGLRAASGFSQYNRQTLFGGGYGLTAAVTGGQGQVSGLGPTETLLLRPGYWINFLWKRALGQNVLNVTSSAGNLRAYAFSGVPASPFRAPECASSPLQLLLINLDDLTNLSVALPTVSTDDTTPPMGAAAMPLAAWTLSPPVVAPAQAGTQNPAQVQPFSKRVRLNGELLPDTVDISKPGGVGFLGVIPVDAQHGEVAAGIVLPPVSVTFVCYATTLEV